MSSEAIDEVKNEEVPEVVANEIIETTNEEQPTEQIKEETKEEPKEEIKEEAKPKAKAKATPKKLARTVKVVELVECSACNKKMLPKSLKNTHPHYCKGQPTETLHVNRQKASYGSKVEQKLRKEIEAEMEAKYSKQKEKEPAIQYSEPIEVKTKQRPVRMEEAPPPSREVSRGFAERQPTATGLLQQSYNDMKGLRQQEKQEEINRFKSKMF